MTTITIDDLPDDVAAELAMRAARRGQSLEEYVREYLAELARGSENAELLRQVRERKMRYGSRLRTEGIVSDITEGRHER